MKVLNVMFSKGKGGLEQAFLDYSAALNMRNVEVTNVVHPKSNVISMFPENSQYELVSNFGRFDFLCSLKLKRLIEKKQPNLIITHGNRANELIRRACNLVPIVAVCHNNSYKRLIGSEAIFVVNERLQSEIKDKNPNQRVIYIPNMIRISETSMFKEKEVEDKVVIGVLSRLVEEKGIQYLFEAVKVLKDEGFAVEVKVGGVGDYESKLNKQVKSLGLVNDVQFLGWMEEGDKEQFFESLDIYCLPSLRESFGISLIEAMLASKPPVVSDTDGPSQIVTNNGDGLIFEKGNVDGLVKQLRILMERPKLRKKLAKKAYITAQSYSIFSVSMQLRDALDDVLFISRHSDMLP